jgi:hypothetical protein
LKLLQQVHLEDNGSLDNLPLNTYFSGLLDLADDSKASAESDYRKTPSASLPFPGNGPSMSKKVSLPVSRPPPLRQPFFAEDGEKKLLSDQVSIKRTVV